MHTELKGQVDELSLEIKSDDIVESNTLIPPEATLVVTEFTDVFVEDNTLIPPEVSLFTQSLLMPFLNTSWASYHRCVISNTPLI